MYFLENYPIFIFILLQDLHHFALNITRTGFSDEATNSLNVYKSPSSVHQSESPVGTLSSVAFSVSSFNLADATAAAAGLYLELNALFL